MRRRSGRRPIAVIIALALAVILSLPSVGTLSAFADEDSQASSQTEQSGTDQSGEKDSGSSGSAVTSGSGSTSSAKSGAAANKTDEEEANDQTASGNGTEDQAGAAAKNGGTADYDESDIGELKLVYGDPSLSDDDAFVLLIFGDGFTSDEQTKFYEEATNTAKYIMETSPYDEFENAIKIYALGTNSKDSGAKGATATTKAEADADTTDTFFGTRYWLYGMQRLLGLEEGSEGVDLVNTLQKKYLPAADFSMMIVNSDVYGGSGGDICVASLNSSAREIMMHEMGHTVGGLADEYWAGESYADESKPNMTQESDPTKVKWSRFVGKNGVGVYEYTDGGDGWYHPSRTCKMLYLGKDHEFCEVCKEQLRKRICERTNVTELFFQTYADKFYASDTGTDMSQYFIIRKAGSETTGDKLGSALKLTYKDSDGNVLDETPSTAGTYTVTATFSGNDTYDAATQTGTYTIEPADLITITAENKVYDGTPEDVSIDVDYDKEYTTEMHFTGEIPYTDSLTENYDSDEAPAKPGTYTVTVTAYDMETGNMISRKSQDFQIKFKTTALVNNDDPNYWGAAVYYNNKQIVITGEGFTADEQDEFEKLAEEYTDYIQSQEPFKETSVYFDFTTAEAESNESGIGLEGVGARDTYFKLTRDSLGKIVPNSQATAAAMYIGGKVVTAYYKNVIVIVNDDNVTEGAEDGRVTYVGKNESGKEYAARVLLNKLTGNTADYLASTDEEKAAQRLALLNNIYIEWYGGNYATIVSRAYDEKFVENGTAYDLTPYFHTYVGDKEVPQDKVNLVLTYYADNNGEVGEQLDSAPSKAGMYHVRAEILPPDGQDYSEVVVDDDTTYYIPPARGWTTYTIQPADSSGTSGNNGSTTKTVKTTRTVKVTSGVKTGDQGHLAFYALVLICAAAACAEVIRRRHRSRRN